MDARKNKRSLWIGIPGITLQCVGVAIGIYLEEYGGSPLAWVLGDALIWSGTGLLVVGLGYYASAKGRHWAWGFLGLLSIFGLIVLALLSDRHWDRTGPRSMPLDATKTVEIDGPVFRCHGCDYILNGITAPSCPECGKQFDINKPESMRVVDGRGRDWGDPPWTSRWSLICGVLALMMFCVPILNFIPTVLGIVFGHMARRTCRIKPGLRRSGLVALAGLIVSYIAVPIVLLFGTYMLYLMIYE